MTGKYCVAFDPSESHEKLSEASCETPKEFICSCGMQSKKAMDPSMFVFL